MTEEPISTCVAPNCEQLAATNSALCITHKAALQKIESDILSNATRRIKADMRQFERLILIEPPLHSAEIAHRMPMPVREVRKWLRKFKDDRA